MYNVKSELVERSEIFESAPLLDVDLGRLLRSGHFSEFTNFIITATAQTLAHKRDQLEDLQSKVAKIDSWISNFEQSKSGPGSKGSRIRGVLQETVSEGSILRAAQSPHLTVKSLNQVATPSEIAKSPSIQVSKQASEHRNLLDDEERSVLKSAISKTVTRKQTLPGESLGEL